MIRAERWEDGAAITVVPAAARRSSAIAALLAAGLSLGLLLAAAAATISAEELGFAAPLAGGCPSLGGLVALGLATWFWMARHATVRIVVDREGTRIERHHPLRHSADVLVGALEVEVRPHAVELRSSDRSVVIGGLTTAQAAELGEALAAVG